MPTESASAIQPHDRVIHVVVRKRALDEASTRRLCDEVLTAAAGQPGRPIVLDLSAVRFAPSVALGLLVQMVKSLRLDGRRTALIGIEERILGTIRVTQLHQVLEIHDTLQEAADAMVGNR